MHSEETQVELVDELTTLNARVAALREARASITYDLEWAIKERERIRRHLAVTNQKEKG